MMLFQDQRPRFFEGQYLGAADLTAAVAYGRLQNARHALGAHTWGIAMGLQLQEKPLPGGQVEVHILPGYAWDGFGRPIVILTPYKIPPALFGSITFQPGVDDTNTGIKGRLIPVWLRYDESATQNVRPGFEVCDTNDQHARVRETFRVEIGTRSAHADRHDLVSLAGQSVDAEQALKRFEPGAPAVYDESVPHQMLPGEGERARWLIPLGYVRWLPVQNQPGHFVPRDDADRPAGSPDPFKDSDKIRTVRRYIGIVAEAFEAADGAIRLRDRYKAPSNVYRPPLMTTDPNNPPVNDLVWIEGHLRVLGDARLVGGRLDFRDATGEDAGVPLKIQRTGDNPPGDRALQLLLGPDSQSNNRFAVGPLRADNSVDEKFVVLSGGNVGIGTSAPQNSLHVARHGHLNAIFDNTQQSEHLTVVVGSAGSGLRFAETNDFFIASQPYANRNDNGFGNERLRITAAGNVGIGTNAPTQLLTLGAPEGTKLEIARISGSLPWNQLSGVTNPGAFVINQQSQGSSMPGADFALMRDRKKRVTLGDAHTYVSSQDGGEVRLLVNFEEAGEQEIMRLTAAGNTGIGTNAPLSTLHVARHSHLNVILERNDAFLEHLTLVVGSGGSGVRFSNTNDFFIASEPFADRNSLGFGTAEHFRITSAGNVGIGTTGPTERLDVRGNIRFGPNGDVFAIGALQNLRLIVGRVNSNGTLAAGSGFNSSPAGTGNYNVAFTAPFSTTPFVLASAVNSQGDDHIVTIRNITAIGFQVTTIDAIPPNEGSNQDTEFTFVALGTP